MEHTPDGSDSPGKHKHLRRLDRIFVEVPAYFLTTCTCGRRRVLDQEEIHQILVEEWTEACPRHGWSVGRYVVMPDHVHFFAAPTGGEGSKDLSQFVGAWKEWTSKRMKQSNTSGTADLCPGKIWQPEFFDHLLRSGESYSEKWAYVRDNPVRAGLVRSWEDWPYSGTIVDLRL